MRRPSYRAAIAWLAANDDCDWLRDREEPSLSISASLVADMFEVPDSKVARDLALHVANACGYSLDQLNPEAVARLVAERRGEKVPS